MRHHFIINLPGLEDLTLTKVEEVEGNYHLHVECERTLHRCPQCNQRTNTIHDYRLQKIQHLKMFERQTYLFYKRRRYRCVCGKRFAETNSFIGRYQRHSKEWNQALNVRVIKGKTFKETGEVFSTSSATVMRRFDRLAAEQLEEVTELPPVIAMDEYKGDTDEGKFQLIIADGVTKKPIDILPNRSLKTIKEYLRQRGAKVEVVIMDMSSVFKSAVKQALGNPVIVADRFHFCRYIYWALDRVRRRIQATFTDYDRKKCKRMRYVFHKNSEKLTEEDRWYLERYLTMSGELKRAYELKEDYCKWFELAKEHGKTSMECVKEKLYQFYQRVEEEEIKEFLQTKKTFQNWQKEILNSFAFNYSNGFLEGINNSTKVMKRNGFGFRRYDRFRSRILLHHQFKNIGNRIG